MRSIISLGTTLTIAALTACDAGEALAPTRAAATVSGSTVVQAITGSAHTLQTINGVVFRRRLTFAAQRGADGGVSGTWQLVAGASIISGSLGCFAVEPDGTVRVGGTVDQALFTTFQAGTDTGWYLEDNGEGNDPDDRSGRLIFNAPPGTAQAFCDGTYTDPRAEEMAEIIGGNVQLH